MSPSPTKYPSNLDVIETPIFSDSMSENEREEKRAKYIIKMYREKIAKRDANRDQESRMHFKRSKKFAATHIDDRVNHEMAERLDMDHSQLLVYDDQPLVAFDGNGSPMGVQHANTDALPKL